MSRYAWSTSFATVNRGTTRSACSARSSTSSATTNTPATKQADCAEPRVHKRPLRNPGRFTPNLSGPPVSPLWRWVCSGSGSLRSFRPRRPLRGIAAPGCKLSDCFLQLTDPSCWFLLSGCSGRGFSSAMVKSSSLRRGARGGSVPRTSTSSSSKEVLRLTDSCTGVSWLFVPKRVTMFRFRKAARPPRRRCRRQPTARITFCFG